MAQAMQVFGYLILLVSLFPVMIVVLVPVWRLELMAWLAGLTPVPAVLTFAAVLWGFAIVFLGLTLTRFQRGRLAFETPN